MSNDLVKVKPKKEYDWHQDAKFVYIRLQLPNTSIKKIEVYLSDLVLRVTSLEKHSTHLFDLFDKVNYRSKENRNTYAGGVLEITLVKEQDGAWPALLVDLPIAQLRERRKQSQQRYEATTHEVLEKKEKLRDEFDRKATQELMRFEQEERDKLESKKREEKEQALQEVYKDIDQQGKIIGKPESVKSKKENWDEKERFALEVLEKEQREEQEKREEARKLAKTATLRLAAANPKNSLFSAEQIEASELDAIKNSEKYEEIPIRKSENIALKFTEKPYPHVATRESHYLDPPVPSSRGANKGNKAQALEDRNPLWLKDKGDKFVSNRDFASALSAYNQSLKLDDKQLPALLNRSYVHLKMFNFNECIQDCNRAQVLLQGMIGTNEDSNKSKRTLAKLSLRKAVCLAWKGDLDSAKATFEQTKQNFGEALQQSETDDIEVAIRTIETRWSSNLKKQEADVEFKRGNLQLSAKLYKDSTDIDNNEYSHSNRALVLLKLNRAKDVIEEADKALASTQLLTQHSQLGSNIAASSHQATNLIIKILLRKAAALKQLGSFADSLDTVREALRLDNEDKECATMHKQLEQELNKQKARRLKEEAALLLKDSKFEAALDRYNECLKLLDASEVLEYLAILQNRCVCYLKLQQWDDIVSTAIRSLKIIHSQQHRLMSFDNSKIDREQKDKLKEYEVRILVRRANAYLNLGQNYSAKGDLEKALQLSPDNASVKTQLDKINQVVRQNS